MFIPTVDKTLLLVALVSFIIGNTLTILWCWVSSLPCQPTVDHPRRDTTIRNAKAPAGYEIKTILRSSQQKEEQNLLLDPRVTEYIGEKSCVCTGKWHKDYFSPQQWAVRQKQQQASLERYTRRRTPLKDFHNQVDGFSPLSYPAHGVYVTPLRAVLLDGLRIDWFDSTKHSGDTELVVKLYARRGIFRMLALVETVKIDGFATAYMVIQTSSPTLLNQQLQQVVYQNTEFDGNTFDTVELYYGEFNATIPIRIHHRQVTWLFEQGSGRVQDRVTVVVKAFLRYGLLRRLIDSFKRFYPGTRIVVADDSPKSRYERVNEGNTDQYRMPEYTGYFAGRNLGLSQVSTEYFLYMDDDHYLKPSTKLEVLVSLLDKTDFHVASGAYEDLEEFASAIRVVGNKTHACFEKLREHRQEIDGFPYCYTADHTENFFMASTAEVKAVGFDPHPAQSRVGHQEFFTAALGRLRIAVCRFVIVGHNKSAEVDPMYDKRRHTDRKYRDMRTRHNLYRDNLTCTGLKYPRIETYALHMMISAIIIVCGIYIVNEL